jgi:hypothetical protein
VLNVPEKVTPRGDSGEAPLDMTGLTKTGLADMTVFTEVKVVKMTAFTGGRPSKIAGLTGFDLEFSAGSREKFLSPRESRREVVESQHTTSLLNNATKHPYNANVHNIKCLSNTGQLLARNLCAVLQNSTSAIARPRLVHWGLP